MIERTPFPVTLPTASRENDNPARRLWNSWREGQQPRVEDFLVRAGIHEARQVLEVLLVDQAERFRLGQGISVERYLDSFPMVRDNAELAIDLVFGEYLLREELGEEPKPEEYVHRFPQYAGALELQFQLHQAMGAGCEVLPLPSEGSVTRPGTSRSDVQTGAETLPTIPGFDFFEVLGRGGMGVVYRAFQTGLNRAVAIKMVHAGAHASPQVLARFRIEAEAVARLQHPNIVQIHEVGQHAGCPFLVLELVTGRSLARWLDGTPRPSRQAAELVEVVARAIHAAHLQGVVHRDLTPANILLTADGAPKITDFGLAKLIIGGGEPRTQTGELLGTPSYMAPEQAEGRRRAIGAATDVYALGAILYEMLTGRPPFKAESALETLRQVLAEEPVAPSRLRPRLPRDLETICLKCLAKGSDERYASAEALADDLRRFLEGRPILARRSSALERGWRWCRRHPAVAGWLVSVASLLILLAVGSVVAAVWLHRAERRATEKLWESYLAQAQAIRSGGRVGRRFDALDTLAAAAALPAFAERRSELRDEAIACLPLVDLRIAGQWSSFPPKTLLYPAIDPQLERYVVFEPSGMASIRRVDDGSEMLRLPVGKYPEYYPVFSPDSQFLAVPYMSRRSANNFQVWDLERAQQLAGLPCRSTALGFRPDGRQLAIAGPDGAISLVRLPGGQLTRQWHKGGAVQCLAFNPVEPQLAVALERRSEIAICDRESGRTLKTLPTPGPVGDLAWSPDGRILAAACADKIQVWDMTVDRVLSVLEGHHNAGIRLFFNHGGDLLASYAWDEFTRIWDPLDGRQHLNFSAYFLGWGSDDRHLAYKLGSQLMLAEVADSAECRMLPHGLVGNRTPTRPNHPTSVEFSPDGRLLASTGSDGVRIYRASDGQELAHLPIGFCELGIFPSDGDYLTYNHDLGLARFPFHADAKTAVRIGPPELLDAPFNPSPTNRRVACDRQGRWLALTDFGNGRAVLLAVANPRQRILIGPHPNIAEVAVSPDGHWLATGTWTGTQVKVWDTTTGTLAAELPGLEATVTFSPDGSWLVAGHGDAYRFYRVGSWQPGLVISRDSGGSELRSPLAFYPDGRSLAILKMVENQRVIQWIDVESCRVLATFSGVGGLAFNPAGTQLAASTDGGRILLWDLRLVQRRLTAMGLDPPFPATQRQSSETAAAPVERAMLVGMDTGSLRWLRLRRWLLDFWEQVRRSTGRIDGRRARRPAA